MGITLTQYSSTLYWGIILTCNLVIVLFIMSWMHINTMTKRHQETLKLMRQLHKRMDDFHKQLDETNELIYDLFGEDEKPVQQQGFMPAYSYLPQSPLLQQQFQGPFQPPYR